MVIIVWLAFGLRVYRLADIPNGLFIDEAARGYDAFSLAHTGADMFGEFLPLFPRGFDDYTPGLYTYLSVPFVYLLGLGRFSSRYASVWIGLFIVVVAYQAIRRPFGRPAGLVGAGLIAISPWYVFLSRIGTEWNLLGLGPLLTITLAYRGLRRPRWLLVAAVVGGLSLYGYAPVKAFLPLLLIAFLIFHWPELRPHRSWLIGGVIIGLLMASPVYHFSFTPAGQIRYQEVSYLGKLPPLPTASRFISNYLAYFDPRFLFISDPDFLQLFYIQRLKYVGLLHWFELPLILLGVGRLIQLGRRPHYFWLTWLLLAPIGINLHIHSPKPALWLTATPTLHGLAGLGLVWLGGWLKPKGRHSLTKGRLTGRLIVSLTLIILAGWNIHRFLTDLFVEFPIYSVEETDWWAYRIDEGIADLNRLAPTFDQAILQPFDIHDMQHLATIYYAYYTAYPPHLRQATVAATGEQNWQEIGPVKVGQLMSRLQQPGCQVALIKWRLRHNLPLAHQRLIRYPRPTGRENLDLVALAQPTDRQPVQAIFGDQLLLADFSLVSAGEQSPADVLTPGQAICLRLTWQSAGNVGLDYTVFVHLVGPPNPATGSNLWAQHDGWPADGQRPTTTWQAGEPIPDLHVLFVPLDAPPGQYELRVGLYHAPTGDRLLVSQPGGQGEEFVTLLTVAVE